MNIAVINNTKTILKNFLFRMSGSHFRDKFRRHLEALYIGQHLPIMYGRKESVVVAKATNDFADDPQHTLVLRRIDQMSLAIRRVDGYHLHS